MTIEGYREEDLGQMKDIWNEVVEAGNAFPQEEPLDLEGAGRFFGEQTFTGVAREDGEVIGLYILHPNNVGRCGHICNASYAVKKDVRGRHVGEALVKHCLQTAPQYGYRVLQFNAVVRSNLGAIHLYEKLGFVNLGVIPGGFRMKDGSYEDILPYYHTL